MNLRFCSSPRGHHSGRNLVRPPLQAAYWCFQGFSPCDASRCSHFPTTAKHLSKRLNMHGLTTRKSWEGRAYLRICGATLVYGSNGNASGCSLGLSPDGHFLTSLANNSKQSFLSIPLILPYPSKTAKLFLSGKTDNYSGAVYDFGMVIDRAEVPSAADYIRRACAFCCGQVIHKPCLTQFHFSWSGIQSLLIGLPVLTVVSVRLLSPGLPRVRIVVGKVRQVVSLSRLSSQLCSQP